MNKTLTALYGTVTAGTMVVWPQIEQLVLTTILILATYFLDKLAKFIKKKIDEKLNVVDPDVQDH